MKTRRLISMRPWFAGRRSALVWLIVASCFAAPLHAQTDDDALASKVKAAFLFNFVKFVTWPASKLSSPTDPIQICVLQPNPLGDALADTLNGKSINGRALTLRIANRASELRSCHLVYLGETDPAKLNTELAQLAGYSILLVHESPQALPGGGIRFSVNDRKLRFEVNLAEIDRESLQLSSKLLGVADVVRQ